VSPNFLLNIWLLISIQVSRNNCKLPPRLDLAIVKLVPRRNQENQFQCKFPDVLGLSSSYINN